MVLQGLSERHALRVASMSASAYRYQPRPDGNVALREQIILLAQRYRRYGAGMIYLDEPPERQDTASRLN